MSLRFIPQKQQEGCDQNSESLPESRFADSRWFVEFVLDHGKQKGDQGDTNLGELSRAIKRPSQSQKKNWGGQKKSSDGDPVLSHTGDAGGEQEQTNSSKVAGHSHLGHASMGEMTRQPEDPKG
jgi:hypothetical protein